MDILSSEYWALAEPFFNRVAPLVQRWVFEGKDFANFPMPRNFAYNNDSSKNEEEKPYNVREQVAIIPVMGTMSKSGGWCTKGYTEIQNEINQANEDEEVQSILLHFNTYGGEVNGIQALYNTIYNSPKKIVAFIDDDCHSAGYWLASACSHIIINTGASSFVGSIGVYRVHVSYEEFNKIEGIKYTYITSDKSIYKTIGNPNKDLTDADIEFLKKEPNNICTAFIGDVQKGRGKAAMQKSIDLGIDIFTGESFNGINAVEYGLADEIAKDGINSALQKCQSYHTTTIFKNKISFKF